MYLRSHRLLQLLLHLLQREWRQLIEIKTSERPWQMALAAALSSGLPMLLGAWLNRVDLGVLASLGGLVFLYLPETPMHHRMASLMACAFGITACHALGALCHLWPAIWIPALTAMAILVTMLCRLFHLPPPGSLFFVMSAAIAAYAPGDAQEIPLKVGAVFMGTLLATFIAFLYSLHILKKRAAQPAPPFPAAHFDQVVLDSTVIGLFVGLSMWAAQLVGLENPYWVPVSCLAVIQAMSLRAIWDKQLHRILGTCVGLLLAWACLSLSLNPWSLSLMLIALTFVVESTVVRHYGFAVVFITPLTILLAHAPSLGQVDPQDLVHARLIDTLLGSLVGLLGGWCLHHPAMRRAIGQALRRLTPARFKA